MKRLIYAAIALVSVVSAASLGAALQQPTAAQDGRSITVEVTILMSHQKDEGDACGVLIPEPMPYPNTRQTVVRDASGITVGTVDFMTPDEWTPTDEDLPGVIRDGYCVITSTMDVPDSGFYRFTVEGYFDWTVTRDDLEADDWTMPIRFSTIDLS